jgi:hypothetical protein
VPLCWQQVSKLDSNSEMELALQSLPSWKTPLTDLQQVLVALSTALPEPSRHLQALVGTESMAATASSMIELMLRNCILTFRCL